MPRASSHLADELGTLLRERRGDRPLNAVARDAGVTRNALLELETGHRGDGEPANPTLARVERVASAYGLRLKLVAEEAPDA
jgi:DNA-binding phage protein